MAKGLSLFEKRRQRVRTALRAKGGGASAPVDPSLGPAHLCADHRRRARATRSLPPRRWRRTCATASGANIDAAVAVGKRVAERAKAAGVSSVVFDRGGFLFHGRVKALADAAREAGLEF